MIEHSFFIAGTDTHVGKTFLASALLIAAARRGLETIAVKPVSAGCEDHGSGLVNSDALQLQALATRQLTYSEVNPVAFEPAIAPHIAAAAVGLELSAGPLIEHCARLRQGDADLMLIEGAGGWSVPLNARETMADICVGLEIPAILVVSMKLGCLSHALLTAEAIAARGVRLAAWAAVCVESGMAEFEANLATLHERLPGHCLGVVPFLGTTCSPEDAVAFLDIDELLGHD